MLLRFFFGADDWILYQQRRLGEPIPALDRRSPLQFRADAGGATGVCGGEVAYIALGHCHSPATNQQPIVDTSVDPDGKSPGSFHGAWDEDAFQRLLDNAIRWGLDQPAKS